MKRFVARTALSLSLFLPLSLYAAPPDQAQNKQQIAAVVEAFSKAIINKDTAAFMRLFLHENISWASVYTDASVQRYNASLTDPNVPRAQKAGSGNPRSFIERIARAPEARREIFSDVRIETDGELAHVWFDYTFMVGDYKNNWGKESWQLVRTENGWKISAVSWSSEENPKPAAPPSGKPAAP